VFRGDHGQTACAPGGEAAPEKACEVVRMQDFDLFLEHGPGQAADNGKVGRAALRNYARGAACPFENGPRGPVVKREDNVVRRDRAARREDGYHALHAAHLQAPQQVSYGCYIHCVRSRFTVQSSQFLVLTGYDFFNLEL